MKIVCDSCGAKYSIADEKVAGRVFKIRCKKCSGVIVVRGDQLASDDIEGATKVVPFAGESTASWYVVVNGEQQGPYTPLQLNDMLSAKTIDWDAYVWREGFDGWQVLKDVAELVVALSGRSTSEIQPDAAMGGSPFSANASDDEPPTSAGTQEPFNPFAEPAPMAAAAQVAEPAASKPQFSGPDLFAQASPFQAAKAPREEEDVVASAPSPRVSSPKILTGQRNENSVLFSLQNLQSLATGPAENRSAAAPSFASSAGIASPGQATSDGSGLIDIRALASAASTRSNGRSGPRPSEVDQLMSIGTGGGILGTPLASPMLAPVAEPEKNNKRMFIILGSAIAIALVAVAVALFAVLKSPQVAENAPTPIQPVAANPINPTAPTPTTAQPSNPTTAAAPTPTEQPTPEEPSNTEERVAANTGSSHRKGTDRAGTKAAETKNTKVEPETRSGNQGGTQTKNSGNRDLDSLLEAALTKPGGTKQTRPSKAEASESNDSNLPDTPPRDAVLNALKSVQDAVTACGQGQHGIANAQITVQGTSGRVSTAQVAGQFAGTPIGSCVARAVRGARFPRFKRPTFQVNFPYRL